MATRNNGSDEEFYRTCTKGKESPIRLSDRYATLHNWNNGQTSMFIWYSDMPVIEIRLRDTDDLNRLLFSPERASLAHNWNKQHIKTIYCNEVRELKEEREWELKNLNPRFWRTYSMGSEKPRKNTDYSNYATIHYYGGGQTSMFIWYGDLPCRKIDLRGESNDNVPFTDEEARRAHRWRKRHIERIFSSEIKNYS